MQVDDIVGGATTEGLPVAPSMGAALESARVPPERTLVDRRVVFVSALAVLIALASGVVAQILTRLIWLVTNIAFYGRFSSEYATPAGWPRIWSWSIRTSRCCAPAPSSGRARSPGASSRCWRSAGR